MSRAAPFLGVISDTHGLVRPEALEALRGAERIVHAGDVGGAAVLDALSALAPLDVVRGNNDRDEAGRALPASVRLIWRGVRLLVTHERGDVPADPQADVVIVGHSHRPSQEWLGEVLWLNPGSAGRRRFQLPVTLARLTVRAGRPHADIVELVQR